MPWCSPPSGSARKAGPVACGFLSRPVAVRGQFRENSSAGTLGRMCKRLVIPEQEDAEKEVSVSQPWWKFSVRFNVAVTHRVPVARLHNKETEGVMMRWGYVPPPEREPPSPLGAALVRSDAVLSSQDYRSAWLYGQRCVVPLAGF